MAEVAFRQLRKQYPPRRGSAAVEAAPAADSPDAGLTTWEADEIAKSDRPDLGAASVVIAGGRGTGRACTRGAAPQGGGKS